MITIVTARVVRENEQYNYKVVKGESYLVVHKDGQSAADIVTGYLTPFAKEPVIIESTRRIKNAKWVDGDTESETSRIYQIRTEFTLLDEESGKEKKVKECYYTAATDVIAAINQVLAGENRLLVASVARTNLIEKLDNGSTSDTYRD